MIDFSELALSPNESRAARNFLGLSQAQAATKSNLPAHKLKRFETGTYVPDSQFLEDLREFFEGEGYNFHDEDAPGAKAKARGDVFPAGVVGQSSSATGETSGFPQENQGKPGRALTAQLQFMRITPDLNSDQVDRIFDCIEHNEEALIDDAGQPISHGIFGAFDTPTQVRAVTALRLLAENGLLYARLMGRDPLPVPAGQDGKKAKTVGELLAIAMGDLQAAVVDGDKEAQARRKGREEPTEVLQVLVG
ncbi:helix-turn-helix domain-containing protein [Hydrogenophaga sp.]|uniref:helix-turn-helix domain-containing protein n=1 Tax=Hydrogenophaga sp. TaxID=1904254 RepID=UPI003F6E8331